MVFLHMLKVVLQLLQVIILTLKVQIQKQIMLMNTLKDVGMYQTRKILSSVTQAILFTLLVLVLMMKERTPKR
jgi:hypothetical protein